MRFWDTSALVPLIIPETRTDDCIRLLSQDPSIAYWWAAPVEIRSGLERRFRAGLITARDIAAARTAAERLLQRSFEIDPSDQVRTLALQLLRFHPLKAADAIQLAAALWVFGQQGSPPEFVSLDDRLRTAAVAEGATVLP